MKLREIGESLRRAGLTQPALLAWAGTHRLSTLWTIVPDLAKRPMTPAASALALFVAGVDLPVAQLRGVSIDTLVEYDLVEIVGDAVHAKVAILPLEQTLVVVDRFDAPPSRELVMCPDDSSYHLASAIPPGRRDIWIDLAAGSAFVPLTRPSFGTSIVGVDLNPRAVVFARLGADLSGCSNVVMWCADVGEMGELQPAALVTCNAPVLADPDVSMWRSTDRAFFDRMWTALRTLLVPGGEAIVHCVLDAIPELDGDVTTVVYTPPGERGFAVTWWTPDAPQRHTRCYRELTAAHPHLDASDRDGARGT